MRFNKMFSLQCAFKMIAVIMIDVLSLLAVNALILRMKLLNLSDFIDKHNVLRSRCIYGKICLLRAKQAKGVRTCLVKNPNRLSTQ